MFIATEYAALNSLFSRGYKHCNNRMYSRYLTNTCNMAEIVIIILLGKQQKINPAKSLCPLRIKIDSDYKFSPLVSLDMSTWASKREALCIFDRYLKLIG